MSRNIKDALFVPVYSVGSNFLVLKMKKYCKKHPNVIATHFIEKKKPVKGFHGPAKLVTRIWLCDKCYYQSQTDLFHFNEKKNEKSKNSKI